MRRRAVGGAILALLSLLVASAPALAVPSKPAVVRAGANLQWLLRNSLTGGPAEIVFFYGTPARGDHPFFGDWNGDGTKTPGVHRANQFLLRDSNTGGAAELTITYGVSSDFPVVGDWNGDGTDTIGVVRATAGGNIQWLLRNSNTGGAAEISAVYGRVATDLPVVGDWNGDGTDTVGVARVRDDGRIQWLLRNSNTGGAAEISAVYGRVATDFPVIGDWNDDASDTIGVVRGAQWLLRNSNTGGAAQVSFAYGSGAANELPLVWR
jgi:hypothetical protein